MNGTDKRDRAVEQLLRQSLNSSPDEATDVCLDAETIAAWMDGGLSGAALDQAQMHAADCARCQALLATFAQLDTPMPAPAPESRRWFAWLVPLTAAAALATWALLPQSSQQEVPAQSGTMARNDEARAIAPPEVRLEPSAQPPAAPPDATLARSAPAPASTLAAPRESAPAAAERREVDRFASGALEERAKAAAPAPPPAAAPAPATPGSLQETIVISGGAPLLQASAAAVQWRVTGARVEQSVDGGTTWAAVYTAPSPLTAIAAPSPGAVWAAGRGGVVVRSTDGRNFTRLPFPETVDLVAVRATDSASATVTTADGRTLTTTDAGATWRTPLQDF